MFYFFRITILSVLFVGSIQLFAQKIAVVDVQKKFLTVIKKLKKLEIS